MHVFCIRHGESQGNAGEYHSGWSAVRLTENGRAQAAAAGEMVRPIRFDRIFVSDLLRTQETAMLALPDRVDDFELTSDIREYHSGFVVGQKFSEMDEQLGEPYRHARATFDYTFAEGESPAEFFARISRFMRRLEQLEDCENVAVFCHAGVLRTIARYALSLPPDGPAFPSHNCSVSILDWDGTKWRIAVWNHTPDLSRYFPK